MSSRRERCGFPVSLLVAPVGVALCLQGVFPGVGARTKQLDVGGSLEVKDLWVPQEVRTWKGTKKGCHMHSATELGRGIRLEIGHGEHSYNDTF